MHYTNFGDPRPANRDEMEEALQEIDYCFEGGDHVRIEASGETEGIFAGFTATAIDEFEVEFSTAGYADIEALKADLRSVGFTSIEVM